MQTILSVLSLYYNGIVISMPFWQNDDSELCRKWSGVLACSCYCYSHLYFPTLIGGT
jgi:hypothetical protein